MSLWQVSGHIVVEWQFALVLKLQDGSRGELLGDWTDLVDRASRRRNAELDVGEAISAEHESLTSLRNTYGHPGDQPPAHRRRGDGIDRPREVRVRERLSPVTLGGAQTDEGYDHRAREAKPARW